jgi:hypothetical protein
MNGSGSPARFLRVSLWELFLVLGLVAVGSASLKYAGEVWWIVLSSVMLAGFLAAAVAAVVGRGPMQARAIGFVLCVAIYLLLIWSAPVNNNGTASRELDPYTGRLPTTRLLRPLHTALSTQTWIDAATGRPMPNFDPHAGIGLNVYSRDSLDRGQFTAIGHLLWAFLLGYLGSRLAAWIDVRRGQQQGSPSSARE